MRRFSTFLPLLALTACAVGPNYQAPQTPAAGAFVSAASPAFSSAPIREDWWRLFDAPVLDRLVGEALTANKDIAVAAANLAQVRAALSEVQTNRLPTTGLSGSASRIRQPGTNGQDVEGNSLSAGFDVAYEVDFFGRIGRGIEAATADADAAQASLEVVRIAVASETARAYADACSAGVQLAVANRTLDLQQQSYDLTVRQLDAGRGTGLDTSRARTALDTTRSTLPPLEAQRDSALFRLAVLTGRPPADLPTDVRACVAPPQVRQTIPVGDGAALLGRRPDVRQAERQLAAATARIGLVTADLYPSVRLGGSIGASSLDGSSIGDGFQFSVGPLISWTIPNRAAARARIAQAGAGADAAFARFEQANLVALQETETALTQYARELDRRTALTSARDESNRAVGLARMRYNAGIDNFLTVLDAERTLAALESQLAQSDAQITTNQIAVFKALGGGWAGS